VHASPGESTPTPADAADGGPAVALIVVVAGILVVAGLLAARRRRPT
jgi:hypothetical protein